MSYITESWVTNIFLGFTLFLLTLYYYLKSGYGYWKRKKVPYAEPVLGFGNFLPIFLKKMNFSELIVDLYHKFDKERFFGIYQYTKPTLIIKDPKLIEQILIKDFSHFENRGLSYDESDPLTINLVNITGSRWRSLRHKLTPTFSSGKLKGLFHIISQCGEDILQTIQKYAETGEKAECKDLAFLYSTDVIASCAFGLDIKDEEECVRFKEMVNKAQGLTRFGFIRFTLRYIAPGLAKFIGIKSVPADANDYFMSITKQTIEHRSKNKIKRDDFFQLLLTLKEQDEMGKPYLTTHKTTLETDSLDKDDIQLQYAVGTAPPTDNFVMTEEMIAAQTFVFLTGGSETLSTTISTVLYYLAENPSVQVKLQEEIDSVLKKHNGQWSYQAVKEMVYLDQVIQESQRIFPIATIHLRMCTSPYRIPGTDIVIDKGTAVIVPMVAIHTDPKYYTEPQKFDPDRFVGNNFKPSGIYSPFGDGPRICIAMRFAVIQMKVFVARVMLHYSVQPTSKTKKPIRYDPTSIQARAEGGIWIKFEKRNL